MKTVYACRDCGHANSFGFGPAGHEECPICGSDQVYVEYDEYLERQRLGDDPQLDLWALEQIDGGSDEATDWD